MIGRPRSWLPVEIVDLYDRARFESSTLWGRFRRRGSPTVPVGKGGFLNLGSGGTESTRPAGFVNADHYHFGSEVDLCLDLRDPLPFECDHWKGIALHHVLEHLDRPVAQVLLGECHRVLEPGGVLRIAVPDAGLVVQLYAAAEAGDLKAEKKLVTLLPDHFGPFETPMAVVNEIFQSIPENRHRFGWDARTLKHDLAAAGFSEMAVTKFGNSALPPLAKVDQESWSEFTLYVEAIK